MSEKTRWPRAEALKLAADIEAMMIPFVDRFEIAGSLRRGRQDVGDIEVLYIPHYENRQVDMFKTESVDTADEELNRFLAKGTFLKRPGANGTTAWGMKNKLALHHSGIPVDFFATTPENWWVSLVIRTGGKETNLKLTNGALAKGMHLNAYGSGFTLQNKQVVPARSEREVFELAGVPYQEPCERA